jgi:hypothetical protein
MLDLFIVLETLLVVGFLHVTSMSLSWFLHLFEESQQNPSFFFGDAVTGVATISASRSEQLWPQEMQQLWPLELQQSQPVELQGIVSWWSCNNCSSSKRGYNGGWCSRHLAPYPALLIQCMLNHNFYEPVM